MNIFEKNMTDILKDLAQNYNASGVKAEFEDEGTGFEEALRLKELALCAGLDLTLKIGGCSAIKDIQDAKIIGAGTLVAPMIESAYAVKKYIEAYRSVLKQVDINEMSFYINIETHHGCMYLDEILDACSKTEINGIVIGRTDLTGSLGMNKDDVNHDIIYDYAKSIAQKSKQFGKEVIIGGGVTPKSIPFFKKIGSDIMDKYETRKVVFDYNEDITHENMVQGILKAIEFEILWLKNKSKYYNDTHHIDVKRINSLEKKYKNIVEVNYV